VIRQCKLQQWLWDLGARKGLWTLSRVTPQIIQSEAYEAYTGTVGREMVKPIPISYRGLTNRNVIPICSMHLLTSNQSFRRLSLFHSKTSNTVVCSSSKSIYTTFRFLREFSSPHTPHPQSTYSYSSLLWRRNLKIPGNAWVWRSKPQSRRMNVALLWALHLNSKRCSVRSQAFSHQSSYQNG
jgi:hypothetical protein